MKSIRVIVAALAMLIVCGTSVALGAQESGPPAESSEPHAFENKLVSPELGRLEFEERQQDAWLASPEAIDQRLVSEMAYASISRSDSEDLLQEVFTAQLETLNRDPARFLSDARILRSMDASVATVEDEGQTSLLDANVPIRTEDEDGKLAKVDLSLQPSQDGYIPANALSSIVLPEFADEGTQLGTDGFSIAQAEASGAADASRFGDKNLFYFDALPDTDLLVSPIAAGVELFNLLRSKESPETLRFHLTVPEQASVRSDDHGYVEIVRDDKTLIRISAPSAVDAQGTEVPLELSVEGEDLILHVAHRDGDYAYPILADPIVEDWANASWYSGQNAWALTSGAWQWKTNNSNIVDQVCCWGGKYMGLMINMRAAFYGPEQRGQWKYSTPNINSYIEHAWITPFWRADYSCGAAQPHDYAGILQEPGESWNPVRSNEALKGSVSMDGYGHAFIIGMGSGPPGVWSACDRNLYAGGVALWLNDLDAPGWNVKPSIPDTWTDTNAVPVSVSGKDSGLGIKGFNLYTTDSAGKALIMVKSTTHGCTGLYGSACPGSWATQISGYSTGWLYSGIHPLVVIGHDPAGHVSQGEPIFLKVDHSLPTINVAGDLLSANPTKFHLDVGAVDGNSGSLGTAQSGMKSLTFYFDNQYAGRWPNSANPPACSNVQQGINLGSCEFKNVPVDLHRSTSGQHTLRIVAKDSLDHPAEKVISLNLPKDVTAPTLSPSGPLYAAAGGMAPPGSSSVTLSASDAETGITEGSVSVDGTVVGQPVVQECFYGGCNMTNAFNVSLAGYSDGSHTIKLTAKDGAGNVKSTSWTVVKDTAQPTLQSVSSPDLPKGWSPQVQSFNLNYSAVDTGSGIKKIEVTAPASGGGTTTTTAYSSACTGGTASPCLQSAQGSAVINTSAIAEGKSLLTVRAYDAAGAVSAAKTLDIYVDRSSPVVSATGPLMSAPSSATVGGGTDMELSITDGGSGVGEIRLLVDSAVVQTLSIGEMEDDDAVQVCEAGKCEVAYDFTPALEDEIAGVHNISVVVEDLAGRSGSVSHEVALDTQPPAVSVSGPLVDAVGDVLDSQTALVEATANDGAGVGLESVEIEVDGLPVDSAEGAIWVADKSNHRIQKFDQAGKFIGKYGVLGSGNGQLNRPSSIAIDADGNVLVADSNNHRIQKFSSQGAYISKFGTFGSGNGQLNRPEEVTVDANGNIWVADTQNGRVQKFNSAGEFVKVFDSGYLYEPTGVDVDSGGNVWVADWQKNRITVFDSAGNFKSNIGTAGQFNRLDGLEIDSDGNVWVADLNNNRIQRFNLAGQYQGQFGTAGSGPGQFGLDWPMGIDSDNQGHLWITDPYNNRVQEWAGATSGPVYSASFGSYGAADGQFKAPGDVAVEPAGPCGADSCQFMFDQSVWGAGPHVVVITATDRAGNATSEEIRVNEPISAVAPECPTGQPEGASQGTAMTAPAAINLLEEQLPGAIAATQPSEAKGEWAVLDEANLSPAISSNPATPSIDEQGFEVKGSTAGGGVEDQAAGEFTVGQAACFRPLETSNHALDPTIVNGDVAVFPNSSPDTDTVLRPTALGVTIVQHLRGANAPGSFSWEVGLDEGEELELLENGDVAIVSPSGLDLDDANPPAAPADEGAGSLGSVEAQLEDAAYDIASALNQVDGEVKLVVGQPEIVLTNGEIVPGILKVGPGQVITAELPPNTVEDVKAMIIKANPPSEPAHLCALAFASRPDLYFAGCGPDIGPDTSPKDPADNLGLEPPQSSNLDPAIRAMLSTVELRAKAVTSSTFGVPLPGESLYEEYKNMTDEEKAFCFLGGIGKTVECHLFFQDKLKAVEMEQDLFNVPAGSRDTKANAFRHAYWTALMTRSAAWKNDGIVFAIAHEGLGWKSRKPVTRKSSRMDVLNNFVGYFYAENFGGQPIGQCEAILKKVGNAFFLGAEGDPFKWRDDVGYEYRNLVFRKKKDLDREGETRIDVLRNGLNCEQVW